MLTMTDTVIPAIDIVKRRFTSGAIYPDERSEWTISLDSAAPRYVGTPIEEVDQNWEDLIGGINTTHYA